MTDIREALEGMVWQFAYRNPDGSIHHGGLSALEDAFDALGWDSPRKAPHYMLCDVPDCKDFASCGILTTDGYKNLCPKHYSEVRNSVRQPVTGNFVCEEYKVWINLSDYDWETLNKLQKQLSDQGMKVNMTCSSNSGEMRGSISFLVDTVEHGHIAVPKRIINDVWAWAYHAYQDLEDYRTIK